MASARVVKISKLDIGRAIALHDERARGIACGSAAAVCFVRDEVG